MAIVAGFYLALQLLWVGQSVLLLGFLGVLFGLTLSVAVDWLQRWRIPRGIGALMVVLAVLGMLVGLGALTAPQISGQVRELRQQLPAAIKQVEQWVQERQSGVTDLLEQVAPKPAQSSEPGQPRAQAPQGEGQEGTATAIRRGLADQLSSVG
ncbi:MAG: AI-2E family transporter, partial [Gemmatimonadales bacterium]|nr:AI-2E family transporter [Gemmatimonadales bacterium]